MAEEGFAALPALHPGVREVVPVAMHRWRRSWCVSRNEMRAACRGLASRNYDIALDTQGLLKSALIARCTKTVRHGFDRRSAREPLACLFYDRTFPVPRSLHAIERNRRPAAQALGYTLKEPTDYGIRPPQIIRPGWFPEGAYAVLLHATSRADKLWDEANWIALGHYPA